MWVTTKVIIVVIKSRMTRMRIKSFGEQIKVWRERSREKLRRNADSDATLISAQNRFRRLGESGKVFSHQLDDGIGRLKEESWNRQTYRNRYLCGKTSCALLTFKLCPASITVNVQCRSHFIEYSISWPINIPRFSLKSSFICP